jgi:hypothetical protein
MQKFMDNLENLVTSRGLYRVWEPARKGEPTPLVARWIDPERESCDAQENEEALVGEDAERFWIRVYVQILPDISIRGFAPPAHQKAQGRAFFASSCAAKQAKACNASLISLSDTRPFSDGNWFASDCRGSRVRRSAECSGPRPRFAPDMPQRNERCRRIRPWNSCFEGAQYKNLSAASGVAYEEARHLSRSWNGPEVD